MRTSINVDVPDGLFDDEPRAELGRSSAPHRRADDLPRADRALLRPSRCIGRARRARARSSSPVYDLRDGADRRAPERRRRPLRRRRGDGARARAGRQRRSSGSSPPRPLYLHEPVRPALRPGGPPASSREPEAFSLLCGRYEGVDERIVDELVDGEISIGDYVLAGGELAALVVVEAVCRLVPGVVGQRGSRRRGELLRRPARVSRSTRGRRVSAAESFPRCCVQRRPRQGSRAWRTAAALARTIERRARSDRGPRRSQRRPRCSSSLQHGYPLPAARAGADREAISARTPQSLEERDQQ